MIRSEDQVHEITGEHTVDLGGVRVQIMAMGTNHTAGDQAFYVMPDGVLFSGDVAKRHCLRSAKAR